MNNCGAEEIHLVFSINNIVLVTVEFKSVIQRVLQTGSIDMTKKIPCEGAESAIEYARVQKLMRREKRKKETRKKK